MKTLRKIIEDFIYPRFEFYTELAYREGEDVTYLGIRLLEDEAKFTHGTLVNAAATLYVHYVKTGDKRADDVLERIHYFIEISARNVCKTWGKLAILRAFNTLHQAGLLNRIKKEYIALVKDKTDYEDFFDKEKLELKDYATNYMQVALACAAYREKLGFENDGYSAKIKEKLAQILHSTAINGWLDDEIPFGRFDRYSIVLSSEFAETAHLAGLEAPKFILDNIRISAEALLFMANNDGNGICYGRSVAIHGDGTGAEVLSVAMAQGLIKPEEMELALAYCYAIYMKKTNYWFDYDKNSFNMWWNGHGHDAYRPVERLLETNLDALLHMYNELKNYEEAGVADTEITYDIPSPATWEAHGIEFIKDDDMARSLYIMKRDGKLVLLPFVGFGDRLGNRAAYYPFPAISGGYLEIAAQTKFSYLVPEYTGENGEKYRPVQHYTKTRMQTFVDKVEIFAEGMLSEIEGKIAKKTTVPFTIKYTFDKNEIEVEFTVDAKMVGAEMITPDDSKVTVTARGFEATAPIVSDGGVEFKAIHGEIKHLTLHSTKNYKKLGYNVKI